MKIYICEIFNDNDEEDGISICRNIKDVKKIFKGGLTREYVFSNATYLKELNNIDSFFVFYSLKKLKTNELIKIKKKYLNYYR